MLGLLLSILTPLHCGAMTTASGEVVGSAPRPGRLMRSQSAGLEAGEERTASRKVVQPINARAEIEELSAATASGGARASRKVVAVVGPTGATMSGGGGMLERASHAPLGSTDDVDDEDATENQAALAKVSGSERQRLSKSTGSEDEGLGHQEAFAKTRTRGAKLMTGETKRAKLGGKDDPDESSDTGEDEPGDEPEDEQGGAADAEDSEDAEEQPDSLQRNTVDDLVQEQVTAERAKHAPDPEVGTKGAGQTDEDPPEKTQSSSVDAGEQRPEAEQSPEAFEENLAATRSKSPDSTEDEDSANEEDTPVEDTPAEDGGEGEEEEEEEEQPESFEKTNPVQERPKVPQMRETESTEEVLEEQPESFARIKAEPSDPVEPQNADSGEQKDSPEEEPEPTTKSREGKAANKDSPQQPEPSAKGQEDQLESFEKTKAANKPPSEPTGPLASAGTDSPEQRDFPEDPGRSAKGAEEQPESLVKSAEVKQPESPAKITKEEQPESLIKNVEGQPGSLAKSSAEEQPESLVKSGAGQLGSLAKRSAEERQESQAKGNTGDQKESLVKSSKELKSAMEQPESFIKTEGASSGARPITMAARAGADSSTEPKRRVLLAGARKEAQQPEVLVSTKDLAEEADADSGSPRNTNDVLREIEKEDEALEREARSRDLDGTSHRTQEADEEANEEEGPAQNDSGDEETELLSGAQPPPEAQMKQSSILDSPRSKV